MFWEFWPRIKESIPDPEHRAEFTGGLLRLFLEHDADPGDLLHRDPEVDQLLRGMDPELG